MTQNFLVHKIAQVPTAAFRRSCSFLHYTNEETAVQRVGTTCQHHMAQTWLWQEWSAGLSGPGEGTVPPPGGLLRLVRAEEKGRRHCPWPARSARPDRRVAWMPSTSADRVSQITCETPERIQTGAWRSKKPKAKRGLRAQHPHREPRVSAHRPAGDGRLTTSRASPAQRRTALSGEELFPF